MAGLDYSSQSQSIPSRKNAGGLNSTFSPPNLEDNESSDLLNIDFDKSGAIVKRNGYTRLNTTTTVNLPEQLTNPSFETWTGLTDVLTDGGLEIWTNPTTLTNWLASGAGVAVAREGTTIKAGTYSAKVTAGAGAPGVLSQNQTTTAYRNKTMVLGGWVYCSAANTARLVVEQTGGATPAARSDFHSGGAVWEYLTVVFVGDAAETIVYFEGTVIASGVAYFDGFIAYEMLSPTSWTRTGAGSTVSREEGIVKAGTYSAKLTRVTTNAKLTQDIQNAGGHTLAYWKGRTITFGCWAYVNGASRVRLTINDGVTETDSLFHSGTPGWEYLTVTKTCSLSSTAIDLQCTIITHDNTTAYFDLATVSTQTITGPWEGLRWLERSDGNKYLVGVVGATIVSATSLTAAASPFTDYTAGVTITSGQNNLISWTAYLDYAIGCNGVDLPFKFNGSSAATDMDVPTGLTTAKFCEVFANHVFLGNVTVSGVVQSSRVYWYEIDSISSILDTSYRNVSQFDGQDITGLKTFGGSLVIFKNRQIWVANFTGDSDIPFVFQQTRSPVGCDAPWSIQEVENGLIFHSYDGFYFFDGNNSYKMSYRITSTLDDMAQARLPYMSSVFLYSKNRYITSVTNSGDAENNRNITWDSFNNAFSLYKGISANCLCRVYNAGQEQIYFGDTDGYVYQMDNGKSDYPAGVATAIEAYYYTKWFDYGDMVAKKASPQLVIYHQYEDSTLEAVYSHNYALGDEYTQSFSLAGVGGTWPITWGTTKWSATGGSVKKRHVTGRGEVVRFGFKNSIVGQGFTVNGFGVFAHAETNVK
jgi:hypothetical protein